VGVLVGHWWYIAESIPDLHWRAIFVGNPHHGLAIFWTYDRHLCYAIAVVVVYRYDDCAGPVSGWVAEQLVDLLIDVVWWGSQSGLSLYIVRLVAGTLSCTTGTRSTTEGGKEGGDGIIRIGIEEDAWERDANRTREKRACRPRVEADQNRGRLAGRRESDLSRLSRPRRQCGWV
jgi:hypothetical protein